MTSLSNSTNPSREFSPVEAAYAVAQYLPADPAVWLEQAALAGMEVSYWDGGLLVMYRASETDQRIFLDSWLNLTPGGTGAVIDLLRKRAA